MISFVSRSDTESADHKTSEKKRLGKKLSGLFNKKNRPDRVAHDTDDTKVRNLPLFTKIMNA